MTSSFAEKFTGLHATPELVGRQNVIDQISHILQETSTGPRLVFLHGVGGIGKTRVLQKILEMARKIENYRVAEGVLDFYHIDLHTPIGLTQAIFEILPVPFGYFKNYESAYSALNRARLSGNVVELSQLRNDATSKFDQDLKQLSEKHRVVLALDTAERIVYGLKNWTDNIPYADSWNWLVEHLPTWQNVIIFVAGREEAKPAIERLKDQNLVLVEEIEEIKPFSLEESLKYFDAVTKLFEEKKEYQLAKRLKNLPLDFKRGAHFYSRKGRPILLSLLVDYLSFPGEGGIEKLLRENPSNDWNEEVYWQYEEALIKRFQEKEIGQTLIALGRVPKGADEELLAALLNISPVEARRRLNEVRNLLVVVKIRPEDQRTFLHDEIYSLLQQHVYGFSYDAEPQKVAFEAIKKYYQNQRERISQHLNELYMPVEKHSRESLDLKLLGETHTQYQTLLAETMYYFLRYDFGRGFRAYYRFSHESIMARDMLMDLQLQAELLSYLSRPPAPILEKDISIKMILERLKTRLPARAWALGDYETGISEAHAIIDKAEQTWQQNYPSLLAELHAWAASLHILRGETGDYDEGEKHLQKVYSLLPVEEISKPFEDELFLDASRWYTKAVAALAHRIHGYLKRVLGFMQESIDEYQKAATLLREIDLRIEMATTMNDMGFAQAERGLWGDGRANVKDALELRRELGPRIPVALSLNTLAAIDVREGQYVSARQNSEKALTIFRAFSHQRGIGMALIALAESTRRFASVAPLLSDTERIKHLREARDYAREASIIFSELREVSRRVEALIEVGTACRDWVYMLKQTAQAGDDPARLRRESQESLREAAKLAQEAGLTYRHVDALVNLAWLEYYMLEQNEEVSEKNLIETAIRDAGKAFPSDDNIWKQPQVWAQKGKLYVLKGHLAFREFQLIRQKIAKRLPDEIQEMLKQVADNYALSLDFSSRFAPEYQGIRRAKDGISERLKLLNAAEIRVVCDHIQVLYPKSLPPEKRVIEIFLTNRALWQTG